MGIKYSELSTGAVCLAKDECGYNGIDTRKKRTGTGIRVSTVTAKAFFSRFLFPPPVPHRRTSSILRKAEALSSETPEAQQGVTERVFTNFQGLKESQGDTTLNRESVVGKVSILKWASILRV